MPKDLAVLPALFCTKRELIASVLSTEQGNVLRISSDKRLKARVSDAIMHPARSDVLNSI